MLSGCPYSTASQVLQCTGVSAAAVAEASDVTDEDLAGAERVAVRASRRRVRNPLPSGGLYELAKHAYKPKPEFVDQ